MEPHEFEKEKSRHGSGIMIGVVISLVILTGIVVASILLEG
jgi:hypothetical protein